MKRAMLILWAGVAIVIALSQLRDVYADEKPAIESPRSAPAVKAQQQYAAAIKAASDAYDKRIADAKVVYLTDLDRAMKEVMQDGNLDEANRIDAAKHRVGESPAKPAGAAADRAGNISEPITGAELSRGGSVSLLHLPPSYVRVGWSGFAAGGDANTGEPLKRKLAGKETTNYLFAHANSLLIYEVPPGAKRFTAIGTTLSPEDRRTTRYRFVVATDNGKTIASTRELSTCPNFATQIDVDIPEGCKRLRLETLTDSPHGMQHSVWAEPRFWADPAKTKE